MNELAEIEAIKRLKSKYLRCIDTKAWDELVQCFTEDATTSYRGGMFSFQGVDAIMQFLTETLGPSAITTHHAHSPEIDFINDNTATGIWRFEDYVIIPEMNISMKGAAIYRDEYVKVNGEWRIKHTGYDNIYHEMWDRSDTPSLKITDNMFGFPTEPMELGG